MKTIAKKIINDNPLITSVVYLTLMLAAQTDATYAQAELVIKEQITIGK